MRTSLHDASTRRRCTVGLAARTGVGLVDRWSGRRQVATLALAGLERDADRRLRQRAVLRTPRARIRIVDALIEREPPRSGLEIDELVLALVVGRRLPRDPRRIVHGVDDHAG